MLEGFDETQQEIAAAAAGDLIWFAPPERKQFLAEAALSAFAWLLLNAFLAGFKAEAVEKTRGLGVKAFDYLWSAIADLFSDTQESAAKQALEKEAREAPRTAAALSDAELTRVLAVVEDHMKSALSKKLRPADADRLASRVRQSVQAQMVAQRQRM